MKIKLLFIALAFSLMSSTCSTDEVQTINQCSCEKIHYERQQTGWQGSAPIYTFLEVGRESATNQDCSNAVDEYTNEGNGQWYRIECE